MAKAEIKIELQSDPPVLHNRPWVGDSGRVLLKLARLPRWLRAALPSALTSEGGGEGGGWVRTGH